ncbi:MAG: hypothetical protein PVJ38_07605 [Candidatus Bathyarchaeota archaeon]
MDLGMAKDRRSPLKGTWALNLYDDLSGAHPRIDHTPSSMRL